MLTNTIPNHNDIETLAYKALYDRVKVEIPKITDLLALATVCVQVTDELVAAIDLRETGKDAPEALPHHIYTLELILRDLYKEKPRLLHEADLRSLKKPTK